MLASAGHTLPARITGDGFESVRGAHVQRGHAARNAAFSIPAAAAPERPGAKTRRRLLLAATAERCLAQRRSHLSLPRRHHAPLAERRQTPGLARSPGVPRRGVPESRLKPFDVARERVPVL